MAGGAGGHEVGRISIRVVPDLDRFYSDLKTKLEAIERGLEGEVKVKADLDANGLREKIAAATKDAKVKVNLDVDNLDAVKVLGDRLAGAKDVKVGVDLDDKGVTARMAGLLARLKAQAAAARVKVNVGVDDNSFRRAFLNNLTPGFLGGAKAGGAGVGMLGSFMDSAALVAAVAAVIAPAFALISGAIAALPALLAGVLVPLGAVALGFDGIKKAAEAAGLLSEGKKGKTGIGPALKDLKDTLSAKFQDGFTPVFQKLAPLIPAIGQGLLPVADGVVKVAQSLTDMITSPQALGQIQAIFDNIGQSLQVAAPGVARLSEGILGLISGGSKSLPGFATLFDKMGNSIGDWVNQITAVGPDGLSQLDKAMTNFQSVAEHFGGAIGSIFKDSFDMMSDPKFTQDMNNFLDGFKSFAHDTLPGLKDTFSGLANIVKDIGDSMDKINKFGENHPALKKAVDDIGGILGAGPGAPQNKQGGPKNLKEALNLGELGDALSFTNVPLMIINSIFGDDQIPQAANEKGQQAAEEFNKGLQAFLTAQGPNAVGPDALKGTPFEALLPKPEAIGEAGKNSAQMYTDMFTQFVQSGGGQNAGGLDLAKILGQGLAGNAQKQFQEAFQGIMTSAQQSLAALAPAMQQAVQGAMQPLDVLRGQISNQFANLGPELTNAITGALALAEMAAANGGTRIQTAFTAQLSSMAPVVQNAFAGVTQSVSSSMTAMVTEVTNGAQQIVTELQSWPGKFQAAVGDLGGALTGAGHALVQGLINGIEAAAPAAIARASDLGHQVADAFRQASEIHSPSKVWHEMGTQLMAGLDNGMQEGGGSVVDRAKLLAQQISDALKNGVDPGQFKDQLKQINDELNIQRDQLKVQLDQTPKTDKDGRQTLRDQIAQISAAKDQLKLESDQGKLVSDRADKQDEITKSMGDQFGKMIDIGKNFAMANVKQFENDLGISGNGAIPTLAETGIGWATSMLGQMISGAFNGGGGTTIFNVNNMDDALAADQNRRNKQALQFAGR